MESRRNQANWYKLVLAFKKIILTVICPFLNHKRLLAKYKEVGKGQFLYRWR